MAHTGLAIFIMVPALLLVGAVADQDKWSAAHATFYGDMKGTGTMSKFVHFFPANPFDSRGNVCHLN